MKWKTNTSLGPRPVRQQVRGGEVRGPRGEADEILNTMYTINNV